MNGIKLNNEEVMSEGNHSYQHLGGMLNLFVPCTHVGTLFDQSWTEPRLLQLFDDFQYNPHDVNFDANIFSSKLWYQINKVPKKTQCQWLLWRHHDMRPHKNQEIRFIVQKCWKKIDFIKIELRYT